MKPTPALLMLVLLVGCTRDKLSTPSLLPRAAERQGFAEPAVVIPIAAADPALDARLADVTTKLAAIARGFDTDAARADRAAGVTGARMVGSEAWITAQTALATLDDWRAQASAVATQVDDLTRERVEGAGTSYPALDAMKARADAEAMREAAQIATLGRRLPQP